MLWTLLHPNLDTAIGALCWAFWGLVGIWGGASVLALLFARPDRSGGRQ